MLALSIGHPRRFSRSATSGSALASAEASPQYDQGAPFLIQCVQARADIGGSQAEKLLERVRQ
jgi:hypothetical protein